MANAQIPFISGRQRERKMERDLMHEIVHRKIGSLQQFFIAVVGDVETGRHTLLRRFRDMRGAPFRQPEDNSSRRRDYILVQLTDRRWVIGEEMICMHTAILSTEQLRLNGFLEIIRDYARALVVIFDLGRLSTLQKAVEGVDRIAAFLGGWAPEFVLVGNKVDLPQREVSEERGREVASVCRAGCYYECSALLNLNMEPILDAVLIIGLNQFVPLPS